MTKKIKPPILKWCGRCNKTHGLKFFPPDKNGEKGRGPICKFCIKSESDSIRKQRIREGLIPVAKREDSTVEELLELYKLQGGECAICHTPYKIESISKQRGLFIDHCHTSGKVRGLLCQKCNSGLGMFNDNIETLNEAIFYLTKHNSKT
jgi:hypothetical protein